jgi:hypothetical protein
MLKRKEILAQATTCMKLGDLKFSEISHPTKSQIYDFTFTRSVEKQIHRQKVEWWLQGLEMGMGKYHLMGTEFQFCKMKRILQIDSKCI